MTEENLDYAIKLKKDILECNKRIEEAAALHGDIKWWSIEGSSTRTKKTSLLTRIKSNVLKTVLDIEIDYHPPISSGQGGVIPMTSAIQQKLQELSQSVVEELVRKRNKLQHELNILLNTK